MICTYKKKYRIPESWKTCPSFISWRLCSNMRFTWLDDRMTEICKLSRSPHGRKRRKRCTWVYRHWRLFFSYMGCTSWDEFYIIHHNSTCMCRLSLFEKWLSFRSTSAWLLFSFLCLFTFFSGDWQQFAISFKCFVRSNCLCSSLAAILAGFSIDNGSVSCSHSTFLFKRVERA